MLSNNKDWFYKDSYFHIWHRVILRGGGDQYPHQVSIPLTALNLDSKSDWADVSQVRIVRTEPRYAAFKDTGTWTHHLPDEVYEMMVTNIGKQKADFLVHADILPIIDWDVWARYNNAGCFLDICQRRTSWQFIKNEITENGTEGLMLNQERFLIAMERNPVFGERPIGGLIVNAPDYQVRFIIIHDMTHDLIVAELHYSDEEFDHISRFSKRLGSNWTGQLREAIGNSTFGSLHRKDEVVINTILQVISVAEVGMGLTKNPTRTAEELKPIEG